MNLQSTKMQVVLGSSVTTNELQIHASWDVRTTNTTYAEGDEFIGETDGTTPVDITEYPPTGKTNLFREIIVYNADTESADVTIQVTDGTNTSIIKTQTLAAGSVLRYPDQSSSGGSGNSYFPGGW